MREFAYALEGAPTVLTDDELRTERYAQSIRPLRVLGGLALQGAKVAHEYNAQYRSVYELWDSKIAELIKSDEELSDRLEINRLDTYQIHNGQVIAYDGKTPLLELCQAGAEHSAYVAAQDPRMATQARRDYSDVVNAQRVDQIARRETHENTRIVISMEPIEAMERDGAEYWEQLNYAPGLAYLQLYHAKEDGSVTAGTFSIDGSDKAGLRQVLEAFGGTIPEDISTDDWVQHGLETNVSEAEAIDLAKNIRSAFYKQQSQERTRVPVQDIIAQKKEDLDKVFQMLYLPLAKSVAEKSKGMTPEIKSFVAQQLQSSTELPPEIRQTLFVANAKGSLNAENARHIEELIYYGAVESIRKHFKNQLQARVLGRNVAVQTFVQNARAVDSVNGFMSSFIGAIQTGVQAGRTYGACGNKGKLGKKNGSSINANSSEDSGNDATTGGNSGEEEGEEAANIPAVIRCIACDEKSPRNKVIKPKSWRCPHCKYEIDICDGRVIHPPKIKKRQQFTLASAVIKAINKSSEDQLPQAA